jgi:glycosyltransferase involved in cell wall biosynthesis
VPVDDAAALAAASRRLAEEGALRERLAAAARRRVRHEFECRVMAGRSVEVYRTVLPGENVSSVV